jgi:hypothetical protein
LSVKGRIGNSERAQTEIGPAAGERRMNAAVPLQRSNLLRLEHELQTVVDGSAWRRRDYSQVAYGIGDTAAGSALICCRTRARGQSGCPAPLRVSARLLRPHRSARLAPERIESGVRRSRFFGSHRGGRAGCPDGTQPEPLTVSTSS